MFEAALGRGEAPQRRIGTGALLSFTAHALVFALVVGAPRAKPKERPDLPEVTFVQAVAPPPPPPAGGAKRSDTPKKQPTPAKKNTLLLSPPKPVDEPPAPEPPDDSTGDDEDAYGEPGGVPGGVPGGTPGGTGTALPPPPPPPPPPTNTVMSFGADMQRPVKISGDAPVYPREGREARVEGTVLVQCIITKQGTLRDCHILKGLPFMDAPVLAALATHRYTPVIYGGQPVEVRYVFNFRFTLQ